MSLLSLWESRWKLFSVVSSCKSKLCKSVKNFLPVVCKPKSGVLIEYNGSNQRKKILKGPEFSKKERASLGFCCGNVKIFIF